MAESYCKGVGFYIDEAEELLEKPTIVVDPPSENVASHFTICYAKQISYILYKISYIKYKVSDIYHEISNIN